MTIAAVVLAGGNGERLGGVDKAGLKLGGIRLIDHVARQLRGQAGPILLSRRDRRACRWPLPAGIVEIADFQFAFGGPLAGIAAAVDFIGREQPRAEFLLSVAVDTPFFPFDFAALAIPKPNRDVVMACYKDQIYPTNAVWRLSALADLPGRVMGGTAPKGPKALAAELRTEYRDWFPQAGSNPFLNINTLEDLINLELRLPSRLFPSSK